MSLGDKVDQYSKKLQSASRANLEQAARVYAQSLRETLGESGSKGQRNPPPNAPRKVSGKLQSSIMIQPPQGSPGDYRTEIKCTVPYAKYLAADRPFYREAFNRVAGQIRAILFGK